MPEACGSGTTGIRARRGWPGSAALILPCLAVAPGLAVACYAIGFPRRTS